MTKHLDGSEIKDDVCISNQTAVKKANLMRQHFVTLILSLLATLGATTPLQAQTPVQALQAYLKSSNTGVDDYLGFSVAVSGDTAVLGAFGEDSSTTGVNSKPNEGSLDSGAAYVFVRNGTNWTQQAYLKASNPGVDDNFGWSVAVSGDTVVIGAQNEDSSTTGINSIPNNYASNSGAAYVFVRSGTNWTQQAYLKASNTGAQDAFGVSVAVSGDTVVVGASGDASSTTGVNSISNEGASDSGAAYVFVRSGTNWTQQAYLKASNTGTADEFGWSVAVSGDTVVVGAKREDSGTTGVNSTPSENLFDAGAAYVFVRNGTNWTEQAYLKASNTGKDDEFGYSVAVSGDTVVVGAHWEDTHDDWDRRSGAAYVFKRSGTTWTEQAFLKGSLSGAGDEFGHSVAVSGDTVAVGPYLFMQDGTTWREQAFLIVGKPGSADYFRSSVAMSGRTVVVGAYADASSTTGVNSIPNEAAYDSGAAYIYAPPGQAPTITSAATATATVGQSFTYNITASNSPTTYGAANLPTGLSVNTSTGMISGTPTTPSTTTITLSAHSEVGTGTQTLTLTIKPLILVVPVITSAATATATVGQSFTHNITASNSPTSYGAANLPTGLSVNTSTGVISGTPTTPSTTTIVLYASNEVGTGIQTLTLTVKPRIPVITSAATATAAVGQTFTYNIIASNVPTSYGAANLPTGLSVNTSTGVISGTPTTLGTYTITVSARNAGGEGNQTLTLTVTSPPLITINYIDAVGFVLIFNGDKNQAAVLQYTTDFKQWFPLATKGVGEKDLVHLDPLGAQVPYRFYRVVKQ